MTKKSLKFKMTSQYIAAKINYLLALSRV